MDRDRIETPWVDPVKDLELSVEMLDESGAALDPITAVAIENIADLAELCMVDVAADYALDPAAARLVGYCFAKGGDVLHRVLDALLEIGRERPVRIAELAPHRVEVTVQPNRGSVCAVAEQC